MTKYTVVAVTADSPCSRCPHLRRDHEHGAETPCTKCSCEHYFPEMEPA